MIKIFNVFLVCLLLMTAATTEAANNTASRNRLRENFNNAVPAWQEEAAKEKEDKNSRYVKICEDDSFIYYMDKKSAKWIQAPNVKNEYIIDVWIKLIPAEENNPDSKYSYPAKYYLEHYYLRPTTQQIQFRSELEITGRPDNNISERPYDEAAWENLVPESVEDSIYQAVVKKMGGVKRAKGRLPSVRDTLEDWFNVSI